MAMPEEELVKFIQNSLRNKLDKAQRIARILTGYLCPALGVLAAAKSLQVTSKATSNVSNPAIKIGLLLGGAGVGYYTASRACENVRLHLVDAINNFTTAAQAEAALTPKNRGNLIREAERLLALEDSIRSAAQDKNELVI